MAKSSFIERHFRIIFPLPAVLFIVVMMLFPVVYTLFLSFTNWNLTSGMPLSLVGFKSYARVLREPRFLEAIGRTFLLPPSPSWWKRSWAWPSPFC
jgi:ABC-type sugar transport systems, permease components